MNVVRICGIDVYAISLEETLSSIRGFVEKKMPVFIVTPNVDHLVKLQNDDQFRNIYENASLVLPDGMPLLWASRFLGTPLKEKISGSDLFSKLCDVAVDKEYRLFFLGGTPGDAEKAKISLVRKNPGINITGVYAPPYNFFNDENENVKIVNMIKEAKPDILFVGFGAPLQERWMHRYHKEVNVPVSIGIGISFSFEAGTVKRAPVLMQNIGLEWLWRVMQEPKRLWKRYFIDDMKFFGLVLRQKFRQIKKTEKGNKD